MIYNRYFKNTDSLSNEQKEDLQEYLRNPRDGFTLLYDACEQHQPLEVKQFITRLQTLNICYIDEKDIKSVDDWKENTAVGLPHTVCPKAIPMTSDDKYYNYSLVDEGPVSEIRYPMQDSFTSVSKTFKSKHYPLFKGIVNIAKSMGVSVIEVDETKGQAVKATESFAFGKNKIGLKIYIKNKIDGYTISDQEKTVAILTNILKVLSKNEINLVIAGTDGIKIPDQEKMIVVLLATVLANRALDYGDNSENLTVERCLNLQLCNKLNAANVNSERFVTLFGIAVKSAEVFLEKANITLSNVTDTIRAKGFTYIKEPKTISQALTGYYSKEEYAKLYGLTNPEIYKTEESNQIQEQKTEQLAKVKDLPKLTGKLSLNKNVINKKTVDRHFDEVIVEKVSQRVEFLSGKLAEAKTDYKKSQITAQIRFLESFIAKYTIYNISKGQNYNTKLTTATTINDEKLEKFLRLVLKMKEDIIDNSFKNSDKITNDRKIDVNTFINQSANQVYGIKSVNTEVGALISKTISNLDKDELVK